MILGCDGSSFLDKSIDERQDHGLTDIQILKVGIRKRTNKF